MKAKDLTRLIDGLSLIAKEFSKRSPASAKDDFQTLFKKALVSATDLSGLTSGKIHSFPNPSLSVSSTFDSHSEDRFASSSSSYELPLKQEDPNPPVDGVNTQNSIPIDARTTSTLEAATVTATTTTLESDSQQNPYLADNSVGSGEAGADMAALAASYSSQPLPPPVLTKRRKPRERRVPSTPFSRALGFAGLGAGLAWGTLQESTKRLVYGAHNSEGKQSAISPFLSEKNAERLANALCRMRGAALKLGQMLSIQDESLVPAPILAALEIVRQGADVMPRSQLNQVLDVELGADWLSKLKSFDYEPMAAASIGQVHRAVMKDGVDIAIKIQYPGVADSIGSDIENVKRLLDYTNLIPKGLFLNQAMKVAKEELSRECDYELEAMNQKRFHDLLLNTQGFYVPFVVDDLSSKRVLTTELVHGVPIDKVALLSQEIRNYVGKKLLELTMMELFIFHFMQTDPNWGNFLYNEDKKLINLIDFGAARDYPKRFVDDYLRMVVACSNGDRDAVLEMSHRLGFLTGTESEIMLEAHVQAGFVVGLPFSKPGGYDFRSTNITQSISNLGATMLRHRLSPPPDEAYSLHRKLSGAFLACIKLGAVVPCRELLLEVYDHFQFGEEGEMLSSG